MPTRPRAGNPVGRTRQIFEEARALVAKGHCTEAYARDPNLNEVPYWLTTAMPTARIYPPVYFSVRGAIERVTSLRDIDSAPYQNMLPANTEHINDQGPSHALALIDSILENLK